MEYKPPLDNKPTKYRYLFCSLDQNDEWKCVKCEDEKRCYSSLPICQSQNSRLVSVPNEVPEYFDKLYAMSKLKTLNIEMKK